MAPQKKRSNNSRIFGRVAKTDHNTRKTGVFGGMQEPTFAIEMNARAAVLAAEGHTSALAKRA
jgi:hypothetical protein